MMMPKPKTVKMPRKPSLKVRHIKPAGRSAFPAGPAAFGPPDPNAGPSFAPGPPVGAATGDEGA